MPDEITQEDKDAANALLNQIFCDENGHMTLHQCMRWAKEAKLNSRSDSTFDLVGPTGRLACEWLDPFYGFFNVIGQDKFMRVGDFDMVHDVHVENFRLKEKEADND